MNNKFKISVIVPIYNVKKYLEECIESVIHQTIGFKENIQLILVNDGSPDNSEQICLKYKEKYPNNVIYIKQKNAGVSAARNNGLKHAEGKYVNFLDSDDKWDYGALQKGYNMLEENDEIDLVGFRLKFFDHQKGYHALNYKFTKDGIIDINDKPENILLHINSALIRKDALNGKEFCESLKISEDTRLLYEIIFEKEKYGIISSLNYNYRKRSDESSAIQTSKTKKYWYLDTLELAHKYLMDYSIKKFKVVHPYLQYFLAYDLFWRIYAQIAIKLSDEERKKYIDSIKYLIDNIDDKVLAFQFKNRVDRLLMVYQIKYGKNLEEKLVFKDNAIYIDNDKVIDYAQFQNTINLFEMHDDKLMIVGEVNSTLPISLFYTYDNKKINIETFLMTNEEDFGINNQKYGYRIYINLDQSSTLSFSMNLFGHDIPLTNYFTHFSRLNELKKGYYYENKYLFVKSKNHQSIIIERKPSVFKIIKHELIYLISILCSFKLKAFIIRFLYWITKPFIRKNIWLFCDREFMGEDSGEIFFRYFNNHNKDKKIKTYFIIDKHYDDYKRMQQYGNVVSYHTFKFMLLFLHSKILISSHADGYINNPFGSSRPYYVDLYRFKYIYLTHGILLHDSSSWLNRINKNFALNVTTSPMEYESIIKGKYYFEDDELLKTGIPRYDNLKNLDIKEENKILFMPSWRSLLVPNIIPGTQRREYNPEFKDSEYYKFYDRLLNDKKLLDVLKEKNLKIKFCVHPSFRAQFKDFIGNDYVEFAIDVNSQYETLSSKMLVTDYSSAACDFAYLNKPVIYANFDLDHIYDVHYYNKGYFDYDRDGFGPNCQSYDETLKEIIKVINNNFKVEEKYKKRMKNFFFYRDNKNCERIYNEIIKRLHNK